MTSASLNKAERNYSQLHREALAIVFAFKKFHKFVYGNPVTVYTDCKALQSILSGKKDLGNVINSRFLRWILFLQNYDMEVKFRPSNQTKNADALSRLPVNEPTGIKEVKLNILECLNSFNESENEFISHELVRHETQSHLVCQKLYEIIKEGWPPKDKIPENLALFHRVKESLDIQDGCIFYANRLFVPPILREKVLSQLHKEHIGIVRCKQLARRVIWWPLIDKDIENFITCCHSCQTHASKRNFAPQLSWKKTSYPFERIHIDHFFYHFFFLVIVDDFSNWIDVQLNKNVSSMCVINSLKRFFCNFGFPSILVSDNATCFNSYEFKSFCKINGIIHRNSPEYHPISNGLAERTVGIVKSNLKKSLSENPNYLSIENQILNFLFKYHNTPLSNGTIPAETIFKYKVKTNLSILQKQDQSTKSMSVQYNRERQSK